MWNLVVELARVQYSQVYVGSLTCRQLRCFRETFCAVWDIYGTASVNETRLSTNRERRRISAKPYARVAVLCGLVYCVCRFVQTV